MDPVIPVVIVGAGPTGLTVATLLARLGIQSAVVERHVEPYPLPRAVHLDDEVFRILQRVGVADGFALLSRPALGMRLLDAAHRTMAEFRRDELVGVHGHPQANLFDQPDLERLLRDNLAGHPQVRLSGGTDLVGLEQDGTGVDVLLRDVTSGASRRLRAAAVLGCDGANSTVRRLIGATMRDLRFRERWLVIDVRCPVQLDVWNGVHQVCDPRRAATFMQIGPDRYRWEFRLADGERAEDFATAEQVGHLLAPWTAALPSEALRLLRHTEYTFTAAVADRWRDARVFLLGDAAHLTPPFIGQGMGAGLRDAANLSWKLALVLAGRADERILDTYQTEREPHARRLIQAAVLAGWAMTGGQDGAAAVRRVLLSGLCRLPGFNRAALGSLSPRLRRGPLVRAPRAALLPTLAGSLVPQPWVCVRGRRERLDEVLGDGFAVLMRSPIGPDLTALARRLGARVIAVGDAAARAADDGGDAEGGGIGGAEGGGASGADSLEAAPDVVLTEDGGLATWLRRGRAAAVLVRPDRVVLATAGPGAEVSASRCREIAGWLPPLLPQAR